MILGDFLEYNENGLYCRYGDFYVDPQRPVSKAVVSHAHGDHAISGSGDVFCTEATAQFMQRRYGPRAATVFAIAEYGQPFSIGKVAVTLISAGHMLGSAQLLMQYENERYLYTGDYKLQEDRTCRPIDWVETDVLITESTFADPTICHPDPVREIGKLALTECNILLGAYGLGKSQRLIRMINDHVPGKSVLVHHSIMPLNRVYEGMGYSLGSYQLYTRKQMKGQSNRVYIVPPFTFDSYFRARDVRRLFASGWQNLQANGNDTLFISDHADWQDILLTINRTKAREVWTLHGDGRHLKNYFGERLPVKILN